MYIVTKIIYNGSQVNCHIQTNQNDIDVEIKNGNISINKIKYDYASANKAPINAVIDFILNKLNNDK